MPSKRQVPVAHYAGSHHKRSQPAVYMNTSSLWSFTKIGTNIKTVGKTDKSGTELKMPTIKFRSEFQQNQLNEARKQGRLTLAELFGQNSSPRHGSELSVNIENSQDTIKQQPKE